MIANNGSGRPAGKYKYERMASRLGSGGIVGPKSEAT